MQFNGRIECRERTERAPHRRETSAITRSRLRRGAEAFYGDRLVHRSGAIRSETTAGIGGEWLSGYCGIAVSDEEGGARWSVTPGRCRKRLAKSIAGEKQR